MDSTCAPSGSASRLRRRSSKRDRPVLTLCHFNLIRRTDFFDVHGRVPGLAQVIPVVMAVGAQDVLEIKGA